MPEGLAVLLDQNVPRDVATWLRRMKPRWVVRHVVEEGLGGKDDREIFEWAQAAQSIIITFDEDFADQRSFPVGMHFGVVRLRVWPTTIEETQSALERLLSEVPDRDLIGALVIIGHRHIRIRSGNPHNSGG